MSDLSSAAIEQALAGIGLGVPAHFYDVAASTNDLCLAAAAEGAPHGTLIIADRQTAGRGRLGRSWWSPAGSSILMSLLLRPRRSEPPGSARLAMCLALGTLEGIEHCTGLRAALKWPNDVTWDGRKLAGMLAETRNPAGGPGGEPAGVVLGLGLNVNWEPGRSSDGATDEEAPPEMPPGALSAAVSLRQALGRPVPRLPLLAAILERTAHWYRLLEGGGSPHQAWAARLDTLGRTVRVAATGAVLEGLAIGANPEGALLVRAADGRLHTVWAGDVTSLRA